MDVVRKSYGEKITLVENAYDACKGADLLVLVTEWREYQNPDFRRIKSVLNAPVIVDGRNIWSSYSLKSQGFDYRGIGVRAE
jgi:UDPglucose 6-dehydrogenase